MTALRHVASINPLTPEFDRLPDDAAVSFVPLEAVWPSGVDATRVRPKHEVLSGYTRFRDGDILVPKITPTFQADRSAIALNLRGGVAAGTTELHTVRVSSLADPRYVRYLLSSRPFLHGGQAEMIGVAGQKRVPDSWLRNFPIPIDNLEEQRVVAAFLDRETARIDMIVDKKRELMNRLRERREVITATGVSGWSTSPEATHVAGGLTWTASLPTNWDTAKLNRVAKLGSGHTPSREHPEWWEDCTIPWITTGEVAQLRDDRAEYITETREMVSSLGVANSSAEIHPAGTVVLSRTASAGFSGIMSTAMATSQDFVTWTCGPLLDPRYLLLCLRAMRSDLLGRLAQGSTHKTIYMPDVESIRVPLPTIEEQRAIVDATWRRLKVIDDSSVCLDRQLDLLAEHRQALITAAVTGELDVPGAAA